MVENIVRKGVNAGYMSYPSLRSKEDRHYIHPQGFPCKFSFLRQQIRQLLKIGASSSLNNETPRWSFSYLDMYCTPYRLKSIVIFPVAKLQTLRFVGFINITSRCTYNLVTN